MRSGFTEVAEEVVDTIEREAMFDGFGEEEEKFFFFVFDKVNFIVHDIVIPFVKEN